MSGNSSVARSSRIRAGGAGIALAAALLALLTASGSAGATTTLTLGAADSGRTITVDVGTPIEVVLDSNASTGFGWSVTTAPDRAVLAAAPGSGDYTAPASDLVGAPGVQTFHYETVGEGTARLGLTYLRPWSNEKAGEFLATIVVRSASESALPETSAETSAQGGGPAVPFLVLAVLLGALSLIVLVRARVRTEA